MAAKIPDPSQDLIRFGSVEDVKGEVEPQLKYIYGNSVYTHDISETPSGDLVIHVGNELVKDLSDCRQQDNVIKFVPIDDVYRLKAENTDGEFILDLPERDVLIDNYYERKEEIVNQVDISLAQKIYTEVSYFGEVTNQLTPIRQILHWVRTRDDVHVHEVHNNQRSGQTSSYLSVLEDLGYIHIDEDGLIYQDEMLDSLDLSEVPPEDFNEVVLGDVIQKGYRELVERLDLTILTHYPRISGAYYIDALQKEDPSLWLNLETILHNLYEYFDARFEKLYIEEKLAQLSYLDLLKKDGDFIQADPLIFEDLQANLAGSL